MKMVHAPLGFLSFLDGGLDGWGGMSCGVG